MGHDAIRDQLLDEGAHRAYDRLYARPWDAGTDRGHDEAREALSPLDVAVVAAERVHQAELLVSLLDACLHAITVAATLDAAQGLAHAGQHREEYHGG